MKDHPQRTERLQLIEAMFAGHSWQSAVAQSHLQISRSTAYRLVQRARNAEQAALVFVEGRQGHVYQVTQPVQAWLVEVCTNDPQLPSCQLQAQLATTFGITVSVGHINRVRAQYGITKRGSGREAWPAKKKLSEVSPTWQEGSGSFLLLAAAQETGLLEQLVTAVKGLTDRRIPGLNPPDRATVARLILTLRLLPVAGLARTWDLRWYTGTLLVLVTGRQRASSQRSTERFLAGLAKAGAAECLTAVVARWTWSLWNKEPADAEQSGAPAVFYIDGHRKAVYSAVLVPRGPVGKLGGKILGCRELVVLHDAEGHPLLAITHRGDYHLTLGLPCILQQFEQAVEHLQMQRVVVDREGMAAELLSHLQQEGRQVVTLLRIDQYEDERSFEQVGSWQPRRSNRQGQVTCEVAAARFALQRPDPAEPAVEVEVALMRDWRTLVPVEMVDAADEDWSADLAEEQRACLRGWLAGQPSSTGAKRPETHSGDHHWQRRASRRPGSDLLPTVDLPGEQHSRLADSLASGYESRICARARRELGAHQTARGAGRAATASGTPGAAQSSASGRSERTGSSVRSAGLYLHPASRGTGHPGQLIRGSRANGGACLLSGQSTALSRRVGGAPTPG